jgi:hypothetical protein
MEKRCERRKGGIEGRGELGKDGEQRWRDETMKLFQLGTWCHFQRAPLPLRALANDHTRNWPSASLDPLARLHTRTFSEGTSPLRKRCGGIAGQPLLLLCQVCARLCSILTTRLRCCMPSLPHTSATPTRRLRRQCHAGLEVPPVSNRQPWRLCAAGMRAELARHPPKRRGNSTAVGGCCRATIALSLCTRQLFAPHLTPSPRPGAAAAR